MPTYLARFSTTIGIDVTITAADDETAADLAWEIAEDYLTTIGTQTGDPRITSVAASLDGVGADDVDEVDEG